MIDVSVDIDAFDKELRRVADEIDERVRRRLEDVGRRAVEIAKETGTYRDVSGRLRASSKFRVEGYDLVLLNDAPYAEEVEARGEVVLTTAALEAARMLDEDDDDDDE